MPGEPEYYRGDDETPTDDELVASIARRNHAALKLLIDRYAGLVLAVCIRVSIDQSDAESVMSDVFLEFWNRHQQYDASRGSLSSYLLVLARSRSIDRRRMRLANEIKTSRFVADASTDSSRFVDGETGEAASLLGEERRLLRRVLDSLPESQRQVLRMVFFSGCTHAEVSERLQLPLGTVKSHVRRGLSRMKQSLTERYEA